VWIGAQKGFYISNRQLILLSALNRISNKNSLVLVHSDFSEQDRTTPVTSFISDRPMYLSGEGILVSHNIPIERRESLKKTIFTSGNDFKVGKIIKRENIKFILLSQDADFVSTRSSEYLDVRIKNEYGKLVQVSEHKLIKFLDRMSKEKVK
jgi:hypothetical protein